MNFCPGSKNSIIGKTQRKPHDMTELSTNYVTFTKFQKQPSSQIEKIYVKTSFNIPLTTLLAQLYATIGILLTRGEHVHDHTISLREIAWVNNIIKANRALKIFRILIRLIRLRLIHWIK
jgi:hypothetical protein